MSDPETLTSEARRAFEQFRDALSLNRIASEAEVWLFGLSCLEEAQGQLATAQRRLWSLVDWDYPGTVDGPEVDAAIRTDATTEIEYRYHELALFALAQPLLEGIAVALLGNSATKRPPGRTRGYPLHWPKLMVRLETYGGEAPAHEHRAGTTPTRPV